MTAAAGGAADLDLIEGARGTIIRLRCRPGRPKTRAAGVHGGALRLDLAAPPEKGRANKELIAWFAEVLGVGRHAIEITRGLSSPDKSVLIRGLSAAALRARL